MVDNKPVKMLAYFESETFLLPKSRSQVSPIVQTRFDLASQPGSFSWREEPSNICGWGGGNQAVYFCYIVISCDFHWVHPCWVIIMWVLGATCRLVFTPHAHRENVVQLLFSWCCAIVYSSHHFWYKAMFDPSVMCPVSVFLLANGVGQTWTCSGSAGHLGRECW